MLQFIATATADNSLTELAQMAIEAGCGWLQLRLPDDIADGDLRESLADIVEMCRENGTFLTVENRPELAKELGMHGVHITRSFKGPSPIELRETLGPEAIIGTDVTSPLEVSALKGKDIDYAAVAAGMSAEYRRSILSAGAAEPPIPVVVSGDIAPGDAGAYMDEGASGIASSHPSGSADPIKDIRQLLAVLNGKR